LQAAKSGRRGGQQQGREGWACRGVGWKKDFLALEKCLQVQPSKTELRARHSSMPGLESSFSHGIRFRKELGGKKTF